MCEAGTHANLAPSRPVNTPAISGDTDVLPMRTYLYTSDSKL